MKDKTQTLFVLAASMTICATAWAQGRIVSGTVVDNLGEPVIGANVVIKGTTEGTMTDMDGNFSLKDVSPNAVLHISFIGFADQEVQTSGKSKVAITMHEDTQNLDDVVVVGYGVQKKSDITGSLVSVDAKALKARPTNNALEALQGRAAGVDIRTSDRPGEMGDVYIRGLRSINASSSPLYVVDGVPLNGTMTQTYEESLDGAAPRGGQLESLNPSDIESVEVLKDASATAIYGSRGANGVVLITTKRGKEGKFSLSYAGSVSTETIHDRTQWMSAGDYITWRRWAYYYADPAKNPRGDQPDRDTDYNRYFYGASDPYAWANIEKGWAGGQWDGSKVATTDWASYVTQTGITTEHTLSGQGGTDKSQSYVSFGWLSNRGTIKGQDYTRYTMKVNNDMQVAKWFKLGGSINATYSVQNYGMSNDGGTTSGPRSAYAASKNNLPYAVPYDNDGNRIEYPGADSKIKTIVDEYQYSIDERKVFRALGSFYAQVDFGKIWEPLKGLQYKLNFGPDFRYYRRGMFNDAQSVNREGVNYTSLTKSTDLSYTLDNMLLYNRSFGRHDIGVTLLQSATDYQYDYNYMAAQGIPLPESLWNALNSSNISSLSGYDSSISRKQLLSFMARVNYTFNNRYMLTASVREDGASQLADGNKWSTFPSLALGWRIDQEEFMKDLDWIESLKLRLGYGVTGNASVDPYQTKSSILSLFYPFGSAAAAGYTNYSNMIKSDVQITMANKKLGWEMTSQFNYGLDYSFLRGRIFGSFDIYHSRTTDLLFKQSIPTLNGYSVSWNNIGETKNFGYDITLNVVPVRTKDFEWSLGVNAGYTHSEIVELSNGKEDDIANNLFIGQPIGVVYTYEPGPDGGIWRDTDEARAEMQKFNDNGSNFKVGMARPADQNGDYKIDANNDKVIIGNTLPKWTVGINSTLAWRGLELGIQIYGRMDYIYGSSQSPWVGGRYNIKKYDYYNENNKNAKYPSPIYNDGGADMYYYVMGYQDGSYLKIRNISFGYNVPPRYVKKFGLSALKVYGQLKNPGMIFCNVDDVDMDTYSNTYNKGFTFGLNVSF